MYCHCYSCNALLYFTGQLQHQAVGCNVELGSSHRFFPSPALSLDVLYCHVVDREKHINKICAVWSAWCIVNYAAALSNLRAIGDAMSHQPSVIQVMWQEYRFVRVFICMDVHYRVCIRVCLDHVVVNH